jgi:hypothetical protein
VERIRAHPASVVASQVACVNHLEPVTTSIVRSRRRAGAHARRRAAMSTSVPVEDGFLTYRWVGGENYLGEARHGRARRRGRGATALDALMIVAVMADATRVLVGIEWTTVRGYPVGLSVATVAQVGRRGIES